MDETGNRSLARVTAMQTDRAIPSMSDLVVAGAAAHPDELALLDAPNRGEFLSGEPRRLAWGQLDAAVSDLAAQFADLGVAEGSRVAIQLPNVVELVVSLAACSRLGAIAVPFPIQHRGHELRFGFAAAKPRLFVTAARPDRPLDTALEVAGEFGDEEWGPVIVASIVAGDDSPHHVRLLGDGAPGRVPAAVPPTSPDATATICWTSGTTGMPKGVPRTVAMWHASASYQVAQLGLDSGDRMLCPFPVVNMAGIGGMLMPWLGTGSTLALHQPLDLGVFLAQIQREAITYTVAPPALLNMLLASPTLLDSVDISSIRMISSGSAPLDPWMVQGWEDRGVEIVNVFGSNEGAAMISTRSSVPNPEQRARYFPIPNRPGTSFHLVDLDTNEPITSAGTAGELRIKGPTVFAGYLDSDGSEFDADGYFRTGDVFELAAVDGESTPSLLRFVDRSKDIIIRGGMNVSAAEIEAMVSSLDSIVECAAVAYPDRDLGERVGLFVVASPEQEPTLEDVLALLRAEEVASYKLPERLELVDALPRNPVGKIVKAELRARWSD